MADKPMAHDVAERTVTVRKTYTPPPGLRPAALDKAGVAFHFKQWGEWVRGLSKKKPAQRRAKVHGLGRICRAAGGAWCRK